MNVLYSLQHLGYTIPPRAASGPSTRTGRSGTRVEPVSVRTGPALPLAPAVVLVERLRARDALAELPQRQRIAITLRDVDGYSSEEVCALLEISPANQRVPLHRARAAVRGRLERYFAASAIGEEGPVMDCDRFVELVTAYLEGALDPDAERHLVEHLAECDGCERYLDQIRRTVLALGRPLALRQHRTS
jgi:hypothetical protein